MTDFFCPKKPKKFNCENCDYHTDKKRDLERHMGTVKHKILTDTDQILTKKPPKSPVSKFECECGKEYKHKQSLFNHKKKCDLKEECSVIVTQNDDKDDPNYKDMFFKMVEENKEVRTLLITQQKHIENQHKLMGDLIPKIGNTNNTNNTINNNQRFNINVFLNEKCKDAINMSDFIKSIEVSLEQLDLTKTKGLEQGLSNVIIENMNKLSLYERPMHCTDAKR